MKISVGIFGSLTTEPRAGRLTVDLRVQLVALGSLDEELLVGHSRPRSLSVEELRVVRSHRPSCLDPPPGALQLRDEREDGDEEDEDQGKEDEDYYQLPGEELVVVEGAPWFPGVLSVTGGLGGGEVGEAGAGHV